MGSSFEAVIDEQVVYKYSSESPAGQNNAVIIAPVVVVIIVGNVLCNLGIIAIGLYILYKKGMIFGAAVAQSAAVGDIHSFEGPVNNISTLSEFKSLTVF